MRFYLVCLCVPLMLMGLVLISLPWFAGPHPVNRPWGIPLALVQARDYGAVVFVIFALLGGKQRRLREGDWVEWAGRLLGAWWLLLAIATEWVIWWW